MYHKKDIVVCYIFNGAIINKGTHCRDKNKIIGVIRLQVNVRAKHLIYTLVY